MSADAQTTVVEAFANDPVAPGKTLSEQAAAPSAMVDDKATNAEPKVEAFANDPVSPETSAPAAVEAATEPEAITHGNLGYKAPGLLSHLRFSSRYFWLGDDAVPASDLKQYIQSEKSDAAHHTAAWSSQTGKGLLYFVKREEDKKTPAGVINLSEITELTKGTNNDFSFKLHGKEYAFQATTTPLRDGWFTSIESASQHAVGLKEDMVSSGGYKETLSSLGAPAAAAAGAVGVAAAAGAAAASSSSETTSDKAAKSKSKDRSVSRNKRASIFGGILAKKDEPQEKTVEEKNEAAAEAKLNADKETDKTEEQTEAAAAAEKKEEATKEQLKKEKAAKEQAEKDKKVQEKKAAAAKKEQEKKDKAAKEQAEKEKKAADKKAAEAKKEQEKQEKAAKEQAEKEKKAAEAKEAAAKEQAEKEKKAAEAKEAAAKAAEETKAEEAAAEEKKKDLEVAGAGAGVAVVAGAGIAAAAATKDDSAEPATGEKTTAETPAATETTKTSKSAKRNSIFGFFQKSGTPATEKKEEETAPVVPPKDDETPAAPAEAETIKEAETKVDDTPVNGTVNGTTNGVTEKPAVTEATPATATETPVAEKRRSSFFGLGSKKEKETKSEPTSDAEGPAPVAVAAAAPIKTNGTSETTAPATAAPAPKAKQPSKLSEFIRRPSQLIKGKQASQKDKTNSTAPVTVPEAEGKDDGEKVEGATGVDSKTEEVLESTKLEPVKAEPTEEKPAIGDVVPEAVSVGTMQESTSTRLQTAPVVSATA